MGVALRLYERLSEASDDKSRTRLIVDALAELEERYPQMREMATQGHVRESELRLQKEIKEVELRLQKEIEGVRLEIREVELRLQKEIEGVRLEIGGVRLEIEGVRLEIREAEGRLQKEMGGLSREMGEMSKEMVKSQHRQTLWMVGSIGAIVGLIRLMDFFLHSGFPH